MGSAATPSRNGLHCGGTDAASQDRNMFVVPPPRLGLVCSQTPPVEFWLSCCFHGQQCPGLEQAPDTCLRSKHLGDDSRRCPMRNVPPREYCPRRAALRRCITPDEQDIVSHCWSCHWYFDSYEHSRIPDQFHAGDPSVPNAMNPMQRERSKPYLTPQNPAPRRDTP